MGASCSPSFQTRHGTSLHRSPHHPSFPISPISPD
ncbi:hypothetical protein MC7420_7345 [Coleofasciculus chthonoplastes PCC 7420]|uniref:Uncharacterized protein n=1 Tax=Coleofasciculus chthonoplastes PCC 7420 TaxID=118168 RepID=B4VHM2_9CYAN|nr:hypothetical protein MC7420_7345 [Coleofasciculus chthonoplastes PCC 7420]